VGWAASPASSERANGQNWRALEARTTAILLLRTRGARDLRSIGPIFRRRHHYHELFRRGLRRHRLRERGGNLVLLRQGLQRRGEPGTTANLCEYHSGQWWSQFNSIASQLELYKAAKGKEAPVSQKRQIFADILVW
jgi:hypothetical protein